MPVAAGAEGVGVFQIRRDDADAAGLHGRRMGAAGDHRDIRTAAHQTCRQVPADGTGAENRDFHG